VLCMGAISGSIGASIVFPINLLVWFCVEIRADVSERECKHRERLCFRMNMKDLEMSFGKHLNMKVFEDYSRDSPPIS